MSIPGKVRTPREWPAAPVRAMPTQDAPQPKPCPFCGGGKQQAQELDINQYGVVCLTCGAMGPFQSATNEQQAIQAWNRRADRLPWLDQALNSGDGVYRP